MKQNVLRLEDYRTHTEIEYRDAVPVQKSGKNFCRAVVAAAEAVTTLMIGLGFLTCTVLVLTML